MELRVHKWKFMRLVAMLLMNVVLASMFASAERSVVIEDMAAVAEGDETKFGYIVKLASKLFEMNGLEYHHVWPISRNKCPVGPAIEETSNHSRHEAPENAWRTSFVESSIGPNAYHMGDRPVRQRIKDSSASNDTAGPLVPSLIEPRTKELPTKLRHESHRDHTLILYQVSEDKLYDDIPDLVHLPFPDETHMLKHFYGESGSRPFETNLTHPFHEHPLILVDTPCCNNDITTTLTSSRITTSSSHDSMKMVEVLCNACIRRITNMPFYKCTVEYDKHPMTLRYFPVENYNGDYFCEVCEEEFNPNGAFYHCDQCVQSMHPACCVSILQKEPIPFYPDRDYDDEFKFGKIKMVKRHPHPLSFLPWNFEGRSCAECFRRSKDGFILNCLRCKFAIHDYGTASVDVIAAGALKKVTKSPDISSFPAFPLTQMYYKKTVQQLTLKVTSRIPIRALGKIHHRSAKWEYNEKWDNG
ncbi:zinc finger, PHD-type containing protein [Tanacetum coccineum]|uniref:Zinc finger, PHD-type containing protein n=1 Tax=Tanacetum coccineum TaxID=301880 RepID=A0ABQ5FP17_9ASTR